MTELVAVVRVVLAGVFIVSAVAKNRDRAGSRESVKAFGVPSALVAFVAAGLPVAELMCALLLVLADPFATVGAVGSLVLLAAFTVAVVVNLVQGRRPACHCFGSVGGQGGIGWDTVARNVALMLLGALALVGAGSQPSVFSALVDLSPVALSALVGGLLLVSVLLAMGLVLRTLMQRYGAVLLRLEALEVAGGLAEPQLAPPFTLPDLNQRLASLSEVLEERRPVLLAFVSPTCHNCMELLPDLLSWQSDPDHPLAVVVVSDGSVEANEEKIADVGPLRVLLQNGLETSNAYGVQGTPAAILVGIDGRLASGPAHAVEAVRSLHDSTVHALTGGESTQQHGERHVHNIEARPVGRGDVMPPVTLTTEAGVKLDVDQAVGDRAVLLFWRTDCGFCQSILEEVRALETSATVRLVTGSPAAEIRGSGLESPVLRDTSGSLEGWLQVPGTPSAVRVRDGALDSDVVVGGPAVLALLRVHASEASFG